MRKRLLGHRLGRWLAVVAFAAVGVMRPGQANAASEGNPTAAALARSHFAQGLKHLDKDEWQQAVTSFQSALQLRPSPEVRFNLSTALSELGQVKSALLQIDNIVADPNAKKEVRQAAAALRLGLVSRLGKLVVQSSNPEDILSISVDAQLADQDLWAAGIPVDPGTHQVSVSRIDAPGFQKQVDVQPGQTLMIELVAPMVVAQTFTQSQADGSKQTPKASHGWMWWAAGVAGTALVSVAVVAAQRDGSNVVTGSAGHFQIGAK